MAVNAIARWMARQTWRGMLWLMRRGWMRRLQRGSMNLIPASRRAGARENRMRQNRFARRHGVPLLTFMFKLLLASIVFTGCYFIALWFLATGGINTPNR